MAFIDKNSNVGVKRMPQIAHQKVIFRAGVNPASGGFVAGSVARIVKTSKTGKEIY